MDTSFHASSLCEMCAFLDEPGENHYGSQSWGALYIRASVDGLKQDRIPVVVKKLFLSFRKRTHVQNFVRR
jgi:hypothetical protein